MLLYVGKTERNLKIRITEHFRVFKNRKKENSLAQHPNLNNYLFPDGPSIKLIKADCKPKLISAIESLEILKSYNKNPGQCLYKK